MARYPPCAVGAINLDGDCARGSIGVVILWTGTVAPSPPTVDENAVEPDAVLAPDEPAFDWGRNWWPIAMERDLDEDRPNALQLLGKDIAVWKDTEGTWHAVHDQCPHRCASTAVWSAKSFELKN